MRKTYVRTGRQPEVLSRSCLTLTTQNDYQILMQDQPSFSPGITLVSNSVSEDMPKDTESSFEHQCSMH